MPPRRPPSPAAAAKAAAQAPAPQAPARAAARAPAQKPAAKASRGTSTTAAARPAAGTTAKKVAKAAARPARGAARKPAGRPAGSNRPRAGSTGRGGPSAAALRAGAGRPVWVLAGVGVLLAVLILPYGQKWIVQRNDIAASRAEVEQARRDVAELQEEQARWRDPDFVKAQARERLHFVMPGETGYVVVDGDRQPQGPGDPGSQAARGVSGSDRPWFGDLWESAQVAGQTPAG